MVKRMKGKVAVAIVLMAVLCYLLPSAEAKADTSATVTQSYANESEVHLYIDGIAEMPERIEGYIGIESITDIEWKRIEDSENAIKTLVLMDTSLSIKGELKDHFKTMLKTLAENKLPNESIAIATYGKSPEYLCDYQMDAEVLIQTIDSISYKKQSSFLYQSIYDVVTDFNELNDNCLKRIIVFSDGEDTNSGGVSKTEVLTLLDKTTYPIYTVGCQVNSNADALKDFFALSRITGTKSLTFSKATTVDEMKEFVCEIGDYLEVLIRPSVQVMDGGVKNIALAVFTPNENYEVNVDVRVGRMMPAEEEIIEVPTEPEEEESIEAPTEPEEEESIEAPTEPEEVEDVVKAEPTAAPEESEPVGEKAAVSEATKNEAKGTSLIKIIAVIILVLAVVALIIFFVLTKSGAKKPMNVPVNMPVMQTPVGNAAPVASEVTPAYVQENVYRGLTVLLEDTVNNNVVPVRLYEYATGRFVSIGRNREKCDVTIDYDNGISQVHCVLYTTDNGIYVEDCQSTNHTYLNGNPVVEPQCISEGDILTLGKAKFLVHIVQK